MTVVDYPSETYEFFKEVLVIGGCSVLTYIPLAGIYN